MTDPGAAIEQMILHPHHRQLVDELRAAMPVHQVDQVDAAADHARRLLDAAGDATSRDLTALPTWLRRCILDTLARWAAGAGSTCRHRPSPSRPAPVVAACWRPSLVVCVACVPLISRPPYWECGGCGEAADATETAQFGVLLFMFTTCPDCRVAR
ncbi:hypothetical protein [Micromonospora carbonacea]|uniref:Uncharacterized protein n=1 Tax=Micromonospora carbonacea TaxID=47853 RepID=A0A7H8XK52_9ACTN|nr:hypothetical protein [Micromonospora carbonacea]MBB5828143.1 hypothetical protein [Micromonospora carbonacea]QLD24212.1 hypothetical protein HXZ27_08275 [Micromonospora carbonacea]